MNENDVIHVWKALPDVFESVRDDHDAHVYQITRGYIKHLNKNHSLKLLNNKPVTAGSAIIKDVKKSF